MNTFRFTKELFFIEVVCCMWHSFPNAVVEGGSLQLPVTQIVI